MSDTILIIAILLNWIFLYLTFKEQDKAINTIIRNQWDMMNRIKRLETPISQDRPGLTNPGTK